MDFHGPGERLTRKQTTSRPDTLWPEMWKDMSDGARDCTREKAGLHPSSASETSLMNAVTLVFPVDVVSKRFQVMVKVRINA